MSDESRAVFLSYASQDAAAAKRICDALRAAGVEVWFDQSELVGGDAWDAKIRGQISSCALFVPIISANTQARREGYFRIEWKLAAQRTHAMSDDTPFLLPVVIDDTNDAVARVPVEFKAVQWTKLPDGETSAAFATRVEKLVSGEPLDPAQGRRFDAQGRPPAASVEARTADREAKDGNVARAGWKTYGGLGAAVVALTAAGWWFLARPHATLSPAPAVTTAAAPLSEAKQKLAQAQAMMAREDYLNRTNLEAVEQVLQRVLTLDPTEADAWALAARVDSYMFRQGYDSSEARRQLAFNHAGKAISLAPEGWDSRLAKALVLRVAGKTPATLVEAEEIYRALLRERPDDPTALKEAAYLLKDAGKPAEAARLVERMGDLVSAGWYYAAAGEFAEARRIVDGELAKARTAPMLKLKIYVETMGYEDLAAARAASARFTGTELLDDEFLAEALRLAMFRRDSAEMLRLLNAYPREAIAASTFEGSKREFTGMAHHFAGREEIARSEWRLALQQARENSQATGSEPRWLYKAAMLHAWLGETAEAQEALERARGLQGLAADSDDNLESVAVEIVLGRREAAVANLERNQAKGRPAHAYARFLWIFDPLRGDPRFEQFLRDHLPPAAKPFDEAQGRPFDEPKSQTLDPGPIDRPAVDQKSIAVLPFTNMSEDKDSGYFADGVQEDILTNLANLRELRVISRTSVMSYRDSKKSLRQIAQELGVAFVLEGSVRRAGGKVRITSQLIRAATDEHVWAKNYDRDLTDIFAIQSELAQAIAGELKVAISPQEKNLLERRPTDNLAAYDLYLKADEIIQREGLTPAAYQKAEGLLQSTVELDPGFAKAWSRLSSYQALSYFMGFNRTAAQLAKAKAALDTVTRLAPDSPEALWAAGSYYYRTRDFSRAMGYYDRLAALQPNSAAVANVRGLVLRRQGKITESIAEFRRAIAIEPPTRGILENLASTLVSVRRYEEAMAVQRQLVVLRANAPANRAQLAHLSFLATGSRREMEGLVANLPPAEANSPRWIDLRRNFAQREGDFAEAMCLDRLQPYFDGDGVEHWQQAVAAAEILATQPDPEAVRARLGNFPAEIRARLEFEPKDDLLWLGLANMEWLLGRPEEALRCARRASELLPESLDTLESTRPLYAIALITLATGDQGRALTLLQELLRKPGELNVHELRFYAGWDSLHGDPRFEALLNDPANNAPLY